jgi:amino acid transporter/nucleotide-binding universal stress UspA family protein
VALPGEGDDTATPTAKAEVRLSREMRLFDVTMIGVGAMIGAGIFVLTGIAAGIAGPGLLLVFLLNAVVTLFAAAAYAELGSSFHDAGGSYLWVKLGLKDPNGFMSGWIDWFAHAVACSLYALGFGAYFKLLLPLIGLDHVAMPLMPVEKWLAVSIIGVFAYVNYRGASEAGGAGNLVTVGKIVLLAVFIGFGVWITLHRPDWKPVFTDSFLPNGIGSVFVAMGLTFIAFEGYEIIAQCSEEVQRPERNVPRAIFLSLLIVVPIYLLVAFAAIGATQVPDMPSWKFLGLHKETALVDVASGFFRGGGLMLLFGGLLSTVSALNATIYSSSRVSLAMGRDRNLPSWLGHVHPVNKTPHWAIATSAVLIAFMAVALPIEAVASAANIMFLLLFIQVQVVLIALRKKRPDLRRGFLVPLVPLVPIIGIALQVFLAVYQMVYSPVAWFSAAIWIAIGLVVYYAYARRRDQAYTQVVGMREAARRREYRILACLDGASQSDEVVHVAQVLAHAYDGELIALTVIEVPDGQALARGLDRAARLSRDLERHAQSVAGGIATRALVKVAHRTSYAISETVLEERCNVAVIGRARGQGMTRRFAASMVNRVIRESPAQTVVISHHRWPERVHTVLLAYEPGPHAELALDIAVAIARVFEATVQAVQVVERLAGNEERQQALAALEQAVHKKAPAARCSVHPGSDVATAILRMARHASAIVLGGSEAGLLERVFGFAVPLEVSERSAIPVVTVYEMPVNPSRWLS